MPQPERASLIHTAVVWDSLETDEYSRPLLGEPVEVPCRWVDVKRSARGPGTENVSWDAEAIVDRLIHPGAVMWRGRERDLPPGTSFPETGGGLFTVDTCDAIDDLRGRVTEYELKMTRIGHGLPERG